MKEKNKTKTGREKGGGITGEKEAREEGKETCEGQIGGRDKGLKEEREGSNKKKGKGEDLGGSEEGDTGGNSSTHLEFGVSPRKQLEGPNHNVTQGVSRPMKESLRK